MQNKVKVGIVGGAGYTAGELLRILINHPCADIEFIYSTSNPGQPVYAIHSDLYGDTDLCFTNAIKPTDVLFLCLGHGVSREFLSSNHLDANTVVIDLGNDFRIDTAFEKEGKSRNFVYGLPEINKHEIIHAENIANPGCFATAIQLALLPLASENLLTNEVHINGVTGATGAGRSLSETSHFSYRESNISIYKAFTHQHLREINKTLTKVQGMVPELNFIPVRGNFTRGIFATAYTVCEKEENELIDLYKTFYAEHPFVHVVVDKSISLKDVINTNKCLLNINKHGNKMLVTSIIDNLIKGASGQAVQNMNLIFGLKEDCGLRLKSSGF
ncbi:MAG: N-acetyl-gamma-glutamyl-phosphate reductase [Prevotellaceae bacterium]|jgi:N-acetyl-gamma-glutamyl-phosphate reductase|nr:N-acetyl-gamma-glutamyl-phosphate reductase [Prevotellaceae bacterium]